MIVQDNSTRAFWLSSAGVWRRLGVEHFEIGRDVSGWQMKQNMVRNSIYCFERWEKAMGYRTLLDYEAIV